MERTRWIGDRNCAGCRYWSEMIAQSIGGRSVEAMCLNAEGPCSGKYMVGSQSCAGFARNTHGAVDDPPLYDGAINMAYAEEAALKHPNGAPMYAPDGTLLDDKGNRSIFDDVDL